VHLLEPATATLRLLAREAVPTTSDASDAVPETWTVRPGDDLWSIAEQVLQAANARPPSSAEIAPYWITLIAANRDRLVVPGDADLIFAGQVLVVPPVASP
jgi:nucleoid-associated protein YgaU